MHSSFLRKYPAFVAAGAGFLGFMLRALLYRVGFDDRGILSDTHPLHLACLVLTAAMALFLGFTACRPREEIADRPMARFLLGLMAGYFLMIQGLILFRQGLTPLGMIRCLLTVAGALAMAVSVFPVEKDRYVTAACHGLICLGFAADMLGRYREWSGNPQLPDYCFHVLAGVSLSMTAYHTLALYTGLGKPRLQGFWCRSALFLCLMCLIGPDSWEFYLSGAFWAAACLIRPLPPAEEATDEETPEEETDVPA